MSFINTNQMSAGFSAPSILSDLESFVPNQSGAAASSARPSDAIAPHLPTLPIERPVFGSGEGEFGFGSSDGDPGSSAGAAPAGGNLAWIGSVIAQLGSIVDSLLGQLGSSLGSGAPSYGGTPGAANGAGGNETYFTSATASSKGDPHLSFDGTSSSGTTGTKWDSMASHNDLLSSNSFAGGYRVSTQATAPNAGGVTYNAEASITTDRGATSVTMQKDGSYSVIENGQSVSLTRGTATSLGNGETVTLDSDGSLTVNDSNGRGGSLSTTLKSNGDGGVDVTDSATNVDLGGYLVNRSDGNGAPVLPSGGYGPVSYAPIGTGGTLTPIGSGSITPLDSVALAPINIDAGSFGTTASGSSSSGLTTFSAARQLSNPNGESLGLSQFDPDSEATSLENIEYA